MDIFNEINNHAKPLQDMSDLISEVKDKKVVMLGESSHGTSEYYQKRAYISLELIKNHGFNFIAVEGDWPPCQKACRFISGNDSSHAVNVLRAFDRWPTWMWANTDVAQFLEELKATGLKPGFHGLDVYSLIDSIDEAVKSLHKINPALAREIHLLYSCFGPYYHDEKEYARSLLHYPEGCREEVISSLEKMLQIKLNDKSWEPYFFDAIQNARIIKNAERYYRAMVSLDDDSWNVRDRHMMETLEMLFEHYGEEAKGIVWAHNTHIGDYRATDMELYGNINIGGLARDAFGKENVALIGFGTYEGTVVASHAWDGPIQILEVPEARSGTIEHYCHEVSKSKGLSEFYMSFRTTETRSALNQFHGHRAIGVVYEPEHERRGNYVPTKLSQRYDNFIFIDETHALTPLQVGFDPRKFPESYPYGSRL